MSKRLSKHIGSFDYIDKSLIVLSVTIGSRKGKKKKGINEVIQHNEIFNNRLKP